MNKKTMLGICPKCGSHNVDYTDSEWNDDIVEYKVNCLNCGCSFSEYERLVYDGYGIMHTDGHTRTYIEYDKNGDEVARY